jgi:hemerythrin
MSILTWSDQYSVKIKQFDAQHQELFRMINELFAAMQEGKGNEILHGILHGLVQYTKSHFAAEEGAMRALKYPEIDKHVAEHHKLTAEVENFVRDFRAGKQMLSISILNFLKGWLQEHIKLTDRRYSDHLIAKGMS